MGEKKLEYLVQAKFKVNDDDHGEIKRVHLTVPYMLEQGLAKQEILGKVQAWRAGLDAAE